MVEPGTVVNISKYTPTHNEMLLLSKGLQFVPTPTNYTPTDRLELYRDVLEFNRRLRLKLFFQDRDEDRTKPSPFRETSGWTPPTGINTQLERYINCITQDALDHQPSHLNSNLPKRERDAIISLRSNKDIVIKPADKGGAIVIWDRQDYIHEATRQLSIPQNYEVLQSDPTKRYEKVISTLIRQWRDAGDLTLIVSKHLLAFQPKLATFYMLPKIHKTGNPGRPIVSA